QTKMTKEKRRQWPRYLAALWLKYECPVDLLVICPDEAAALACANLISTNLEHFACPPKVLLPSRVPFLTTPEEVAAKPGLAVLSVAYHGSDPKVADAFVAGTVFPEEESGNNYYDWGYSMSAPAVQQMLEDLMNTTYGVPHSPTLRKKFEEGLEEGLEEGREEGALKERRRALLELLEARGLKPSDEQRDQTGACEDLGTLKLWFERAVTAASADEVFR
ncbi:MAG: hypothetical protein FWE35_27760, partial [Streptosporangiales bacterium]|nr:hypothetical protein [Streptosporangiales bacterium]